ncbi:MAG TPA: DUF2779 domain-containing protein [Gemmatimonadales bacterium]|nr:DUF2779 domain-containing protein [Gemmatimonadales bacterium]
MLAESPPVRLTKSRLVAGWQCSKRLWWMVHESGAPELKPDKVLQDRFDQGTHVTRLARERFPGATLIPPGTEQARAEETRLALDFGAAAVLEAAFLAGNVFVAADVLLREGDGFTLIEVKSSTSAKEEHVPDVAVQVWAARQCGVKVRRAEVMHLNREFRHPDHGDLFVRTDITREVEACLPQVPELVSRLGAALGGPLPEVEIGLQCFEPWACAFHDRCWPDDLWHISTLYNTGPKGTARFLQQGVRSIKQLPAGHKLPDAARRQLAALETGRLVVEPDLPRALREAVGEGRLGFLDFETINRAVPVWDGLGPWRPAVVQFSYHEGRDQDFTHQAYLAEGPHDPRPELAARMLEATAGAERIVMYSPFERSRINELADQLPAMAGDLRALAAKLVDLLPLVRNHIYHPDFRGSFSLKAILTPLVPDLTYSDLAIVDGLVASVEIARLLFVAQLVEDRDQLRRDLLAYCERDTWAMVRLVQRLRELAG